MDKKLTGEELLHQILETEEFRENLQEILYNRIYRNNMPPHIREAMAKFKGVRFTRDTYSQLIERGEMTVEYFIREYYNILNKTSKLSANLRSAIALMVEVAIKLTLKNESYGSEKESGDESSHQE